jgi:hypothetical protein
LVKEKRGEQKEWLPVKIDVDLMNIETFKR